MPSSAASGASRCSSQALGLVSVAALNLYGGSLTLISMKDSIQTVVRRSGHASSDLAVGIAAVVLALVTSDDFLGTSRTSCSRFCIS
jgi:hypothetical protein